jgi:pyrrolysine biosynthesis protein PylD
LTVVHIQETEEQLQRIDLELSRRAATDLRGVALKTIGIEDDRTGKSLRGSRLAVAPMTSGQGIIPGFAEAVCGIAAHVGFYAWKTGGTDVAGIAEAYRDAADILLFADDHRFVAINTRSRLITDNDRATGEGFAVLLDQMTSGVSGLACGVIGCGPVGSASALRLARMGAELTVCDLNEDRARRLASRIRAVTGVSIGLVREVGELTARCRGIVDATPASRIIGADAIEADTVIVAPGVPHGLTPEALTRIGLRFYHDALPLGVATMALAAAFDRLTEPGDPRRRGGGEGRRARSTRKRSHGNSSRRRRWE